MAACPTVAQFQEEKEYVENYSKALLLEEQFLKQKSRVQWLKHGDGNSKFFYNSCRGNWNTNKILSL